MTDLVIAYLFVQLLGLVPTTLTGGLRAVATRTETSWTTSDQQLASGGWGEADRHGVRMEEPVKGKEGTERKEGRKAGKEWRKR